MQDTQKHILNIWKTTPQDSRVTLLLLGVAVADILAASDGDLQAGTGVVVSECQLQRPSHTPAAARGPTVHADDAAGAALATGDTTTTTGIITQRSLQLTGSNEENK
jgi:hypothetical protein